MGTPDLPIDDTVDLSECDREPIHLLGEIQPVGCLLGLDAGLTTCLVASANAAQVLGLPAGDLVGRAPAELFTTGELDGLRDAITRAGEHPTAMLVLALPATMQHGPLDVWTHTADGVRLLEFEPGVDRSASGPRAYHVSLRKAMQRIQHAVGIHGVCDALVQEVAALTGYDRVMVYRFDATGAGEVIAESVRPDWEPYLGLHYPASDIPVQARALYERNWIRTIERVGYEPVPLLMDAPTGERLGRELDLSGSVLRSVSAVHRQYLANMRVAASMSVSILRDGKLWGLVACHHGSPRWPYAEFRSACELLGAAVSLQLTGVEQKRDAELREQAARVSGQLLQRAASTSLLEGLTGGEPSVLELVPADGVSVRIGGQRVSLGAAPRDADVDVAAAALAGTGDGHVTATECVSELAPELGDAAATLAGALLLRLPTGPADHVLWTREETPRTVNWAGDPRKPVDTATGRLSPRGSFALWQQEVRHHARPWEAWELDAVRALAHGIVDVVWTQSVAIAQLNEDLGRYNRAMDAFVQVVSHDLKEPLRGIASYASFVAEDAADLDAVSLQRLDSIQRLSVRMGAMLDALMQFAQSGTGGLDLADVSLDAVVDDVLEAVGPLLEERGVALRRHPLPVARADALRLQQVFANLLTNAAKYRNADAPWVELGVEAVPPPDGGDPVSTVYVRDNGIGVDPARLEEMFQMFRRLNPRADAPSGAGVGLSIARQIVEQHGGRLWARANDGAGVTFHLTLPGPATP